jgi:hypothetical protein
MLKRLQIENETGLKICKTCNETMALKHFYKQHNSSKYYISSCKYCFLKAKKEYYQKKKGIGAITSPS